MPPKKNNKRKRSEDSSSDPVKKTKTSGDPDIVDGRCHATTAKGTRCKLRSIKGKKYCHLPAHAALEEEDDDPQAPPSKNDGAPKSPEAPKTSPKKERPKVPPGKKTPPKKPKGAPKKPEAPKKPSKKERPKSPPGKEPTDLDENEIKANWKKDTEKKLEEAWDIYKTQPRRRRDAVVAWKQLTASEYLHVSASAHHGIAITPIQDGGSSKGERESSARKALEAFKKLQDETSVDYSDKIAEIYGQHEKLITSSPSKKDPKAAETEEAGMGGATFQVVSDLHLEAGPDEYDTFDIPKKARFLILGGDIGSLTRHGEQYVNFLARFCAKFERVFLVLGNNEFKISKAQAKSLGMKDRITHADGVEIARTFPDLPEMKGRLTLLERDRFNLITNEGEEFPILGCSLWSQITKPNSTAEFDATYQNTMATHTERFERDLKWLREQVAEIRKEKNGKKKHILIITHYAPAIKKVSPPPFNDASETHGSDILGGKLHIKGLGKGDTWVFGHTHHCVDFVVGGVRLFANQRSAKAKQRKEFDVNKTFEL